MAKSVSPLLATRGGAKRRGGGSRNSQFPKLEDLKTVWHWNYGFLLQDTADHRSGSVSGFVTLADIPIPVAGRTIGSVVVASSRLYFSEVC